MFDSMKFLRVICSVLIICGVCVFPLFAEEESSDVINVNFNSKTPTNSLIRSAIYPGWGQLFNQQKTKGYVLIGTESTLILGSVYYFFQASKKYDDYTDKGIISGPLYDDYQKTYDTAMLAVGIAAATWIYGMVDAYYASPYFASKPKEETRNWKLDLTEDNRVDMVYSVKF
jgi:hypothetical protein